MRKTSTFLATALGTVFVISSVLPVQAFPNAPPRVETSSPIQLAQVKVKVKVWRGHRGYRERRRGYRRHIDGFWYPPSAFVVTVRPGVRVSGNRHVRWCRAQYASYRAYDNTWKPRGAPRRLCRSPYR
jgi:hypothetical protein